MSIHLPPELCADLPALLAREWLVTNGLGGFAAGTVAGALTRRYHGLLLAALRPPVGRRLLVARLEEALTVAGEEHLIYTSVWRSGAVDPAGWRYLRRWDLVDGVPTWTYVVGPARLVKRVWMEPGRNVTYVQYALDAAAPPITLTGRLLVNERDYHELAPGARRGFHVHAHGGALVVRASGAAVPVRIHCAGTRARAVRWRVDHTWYRGFALPAEAGRGFDHVEDHLSAGLGRVALEPGGEVTFVLAAGDEDAGLEPRDALARCTGRARGLVAGWARQHGLKPAEAPVPLAQLVRAADQFVVARASAAEPAGHTLIAGYPWFTDWGRDTMIALPGLTLRTGRSDIARQILRTWARHVDRGMIPNRFPDHGDRPEYHTADATLWYLWAIDQYVRATADTATLAELFPVMQEIVAWHRRGTRHNIRVGDDGLVHAGDSGVSLTWMDARIGDRAVTARGGKPIELSALWYDALCNLARLADLLEQPGEEYARLAATTRASFGRFWNAERGCCYDVLDGPFGADGSLRPNQVFAVSLTHSPLPRPQQEAVVAACARHLLTPCGLRTLAPGEPGYRGRYAGGPVERDEAYHQGTVWGWLLGPFVLADYRIHRDAARARALLEPLLGQLWSYGMGSLGEVFDGDAPHNPGGCPAQAWTVAEVLRAWHLTQRLRPAGPRRAGPPAAACEPAG